MDEQTALSVIVPIHNAEKYLPRCIESILSQSLKNLEVILINDGSTDASGIICDDYALQDKRIRVIHIPNSGVSKARNIGIENAMGKYIGFVDSDDYIEPDMYEKMLNKVVETKSEICMSGFNKEENGSKKRYDLSSIQKDVLLQPMINYECVPLFIGRNEKSIHLMASVCTCIYHRNLLENIRFLENLRLQEDTIFNIEAFRKAQRICVVDECLYHYCMITTSATNRYRDDYVEQHELLFAKLKSIAEDLMNQGVDCYRNLYDSIFKFLIGALKNIQREGTPYSSRERRNFLKEIIHKDIVAEMLEHYHPFDIKEFAFLALVKLHAYRLITILI